jgi:DNA-binding MarR family transcriptional regulator/N-acetylglutamate synthase-like GNAT family acetyltransferase
MDFLDELEELALGTRLKRLSERMLSDAATVYAAFDIDMQPKWFSLLVLLDRRPQINIVEASQLLGISQPAVSQFCRQLEKKGLIDSQICENDSRKRVLSLSQVGQQQVDSMKPIWQAVTLAARELSQELDNDLYQAIRKFEQALATKSLLNRTLSIYHEHHNEIEFIRFEPKYANDFRRINEAWITKMFELEESDRNVLNDPVRHIIAKGGKIWFAKHKQLGLVGCCALAKKKELTFELTKMAVVDSAQGLKIGEKLLKFVLQEAQKMPIKRLFLLTNKKCRAAIHLYEKNGFVHDRQVMDEFGANYARCDVAMKYLPIWH